MEWLKRIAYHPTVLTALVDVSSSPGSYKDFIAWTREKRVTPPDTVSKVSFPENLTIHLWLPAAAALCRKDMLTGTSILASWVLGTLCHNFADIPLFRAVDLTFNLTTGGMFCWFNPEVRIWSVLAIVGFVSPFFPHWLGVHVPAVAGFFQLHRK